MSGTWPGPLSRNALISTSTVVLRSWLPKSISLESPPGWYWPSTNGVTSKRSVTYDVASSGVEDDGELLVPPENSSEERLHRRKDHLLVLVLERTEHDVIVELRRRLEKVACRVDEVEIHPLHRRRTGGCRGLVVGGAGAA